MSTGWGGEGGDEQRGERDERRGGGRRVGVGAPSAAKAPARVNKHRLILSGGGDRARSPAGRAAGGAGRRDSSPNAEGEDEEAFEPPSNWKVADLS